MDHGIGSVAYHVRVFDRDARLPASVESCVRKVRIIGMKTVVAASQSSSVPLMDTEYDVRVFGSGEIIFNVKGDSLFRALSTALAIGQEKATGRMHQLQQKAKAHEEAKRADLKKAEEVMAQRVLAAVQVVESIFAPDTRVETVRELREQVAQGKLHAFLECCSKILKARVG